MARQTIDFHAHIIPETYTKALRAAGFVNADGAVVADGYPVPNWSIDDTLRCMDQHEIAASVLSVSSPGTQFLPIEDNRRLCRQMNEELASIVKAYPRRFANLAALPLPDVDAALKEIDFAFDERGFDGVGLFSSYEGKYLGDPLFDPVLERLNERGATIFIHPVQPAAFDTIGLGLPSPILEFPFDSTRMLTNLLRSGALGRFTRLNIVVPHGGGTVPFLATRITGSVARFPGRGGPISIASAMQQLRAVHYDLTAMGHKTNLAILKEFVAADRLVVGYDYPYMPEATIAPHVRTFDGFAGFSEDEKDMIRTRNAMRLLPRLKALI
jgi:predicted TIM-barrel fold metal-dependent hydrolase